jgi:hypothetical protein
MDRALKGNLEVAMNRNVASAVMATLFMTLIAGCAASNSQSAADRQSSVNPAGNDASAATSGPRAAATPTARSSPAARTSPWRNASTQPGVLRMSAALSLDRFNTDDAQSVLAYKVDPPQIHRTLYFGEVRPVSRDSDDSPDTASDISYGAIIAFKDRGTWKAMPVIVERLQSAQWMFVASGPRRGEVWGVLDDSRDDRGAVMVLAHTIDSGSTWKFSSITKPTRIGSFNDFAMDRSGRGWLSVDVDAAVSATVRAGVYTYRTTDGGVTWSAPRFEASDLTPADEVPEDDQPDQDQNTAKSTLLRQSLGARR